MELQTPAPDTPSPAPLPHACLVEMYRALAAEGAQPTLARVLKRIAHKSGDIAKNEKAKKECEQALLRDRYVVAAYVLFLGATHLFAELGCAGEEDFLARHWPGEKISFTHLRRFLDIARHIDLNTVLSAHGGVKLLHRVSGAGGGKAGKMLEGCIVTGSATREAIGRGADAARAARAQGQDEDEILRAAREAMAGPLRMPRTGPLSKAQTQRLGLGPRGGGGRRHAAQRRPAEFGQAAPGRSLPDHPLDPADRVRLLRRARADLLITARYRVFAGFDRAEGMR